MKLSEEIESAAKVRIPESAKRVLDGAGIEARKFVGKCVESPAEIARLNEKVRKDKSLNWKDHHLVFHNFSDDESQSYWAIDLKDGSIWLYPHDGGPCEKEYESLSECCREELEAEEEISSTGTSEAVSLSSTTAGAVVATSAVASISIKYWVIAALVSSATFYKFYWKDHECRGYRDDFIEQFVASGAGREEAELAWYETHVVMKFRDADCSDYARRQLEKYKK